MRKLKLIIIIIIFFLCFNCNVCLAISDVPIVQGNDKDEEKFSDNSIHEYVVKYLYNHELYQIKVGEGNYTQKTFLSELKDADFKINDTRTQFENSIQAIVKYINSYEIEEIAENNNRFVLAAMYNALLKVSNYSSYIDEESVNAMVNAQNPDFLKKVRAAISYKLTTLGLDLNPENAKGVEEDDDAIEACNFLKDCINANITGKGVNIGDSEETKLAYTKEQFKTYLDLFGENGIDSNLLQRIKDNVGWTVADDVAYQQEIIKKTEEVIKEVNGDLGLYTPPGRVSSTETGGSMDETITDAESFIDTGKDGMIQTTGLQNFSNTLYNILLTIGIVVAIIIGLIIGIKFILGSIEEKAEIKQLLVPYIVGCVVVFGAFGIWKVVVEVLSQL